MYTLEAPGAVVRFTYSDKTPPTPEQEAMLQLDRSITFTRRSVYFPAIRSLVDGHIIVAEESPVQHTLVTIVMEPDQVLYTESLDSPEAVAFIQQYPDFRQVTAV